MLSQPPARLARLDKLYNDHHSYLEVNVSSDRHMLAVPEMHISLAAKGKALLGEVRMVLDITRLSGSAVERTGRGLQNSTTTWYIDMGRWDGQLSGSMHVWVPKMRTDRQVIACRPGGRRGWARS